MKLRAIAIGFALGLVLALVSRPGPADAARPAELPLFLMLNGEPTRWKMQDAGSSGMFGTGVQCMYVAAGGNYVPFGTGAVLKVVPSDNVRLCVNPSGSVVGADGGCSNLVTDVNFGDPLAAEQANYIVLDQNTTKICQIPADAGTVNTPVFYMR